MTDEYGTSKTHAEYAQAMGMEASLIPTSTRDITAEVMGGLDRIQVLPAAYWASTTAIERAMFGNRNGIYSYPTVELVDYLRTAIGGRKAIEIGAGHGVLAWELGIRATDNKMQEWPKYKAIYGITGQPAVRYGRNVLEIAANDAVRRIKPDVVIGCWVTHLWDAARPEAGGNEVGIDEEDIIANCAEYIFVGNEKVHAGKSIWSLPHTIEYPDWLYSRATNGSREFIARWQGSQARP